MTKSLLERLIEVDLLSKEQKTFDFSNPALKVWCNYMFNEVEFDDYPSMDDLKILRGGRR